MRRMVRWMLAMAIVAAAVVVVPGTAAQAGASCTYPLCSEVANRLPAGAYVAVAHNWCGNADILYQNAAPCAGQVADYIASGTTTPPHEDWDGFRVENGCSVTYQFYSVLTGWTMQLNIVAAGSTHIWIRVHNDDTAYILSRSC